MNDKPTYCYFVSFFYKKHFETGYGNCKIERNTEIKTFQDLDQIAGVIEKEKNFKKALILNYKLLDVIPF